MILTKLRVLYKNWKKKSKQVVGMDNKVPIGGTRIYGYQGTYYSSPEEIIQALKGKKNHDSTITSY